LGILKSILKPDAQSKSTMQPGFLAVYNDAEVNIFSELCHSLCLQFNGSLSASIAPICRLLLALSITKMQARKQN
jgi:hypothetical protein